MQADQPTADEPEPAASSEDRGSPSTNTARSYECTFCKRGFSNAQALGGHMNIHRKDRAKLKQPSNHAQLPFDISPRISPSYPPVPSSYMPVLTPGGNDRGLVFNQSWTDPRENDGPRQLPLFVDTPSSRADDRSSDGIGRRQEEMVRLPDTVELDLELRLGPERPDSSVGLKEFV